jgi:hypothetical protein
MPIETRSMLVATKRKAKPFFSTHKDEPSEIRAHYNMPLRPARFVLAH